MDNREICEDCRNLVPLPGGGPGYCKLSGRVRPRGCLDFSYRAPAKVTPERKKRKAKKSAGYRMTTRRESMCLDCASYAGGACLLSGQQNPQGCVEFCYKLKQ